MILLKYKLPVIIALSSFRHPFCFKKKRGGGRACYGQPSFMITRVSNSGDIDDGGDRVVIVLRVVMAIGRSGVSDGHEGGNDCGDRDG